MMKKAAVFGIGALALLLCVFAGCPTDSDSPAKMVFANDDKEFSINEKLSFNISFRNGYSLPVPEMENYNLGYVKIWGTIKSENKWDDPVVSGEIRKINSDDKIINSHVGEAIGVLLTLTYKVDEETGEITEVDIDFLGEDGQVFEEDGETLTFPGFCQYIIGGKMPVKQ